jgi:hypothetical protein
LSLHALRHSHKPDLHDAIDCARASGYRPRVRVSYDMGSFL